MKQLCRYPSRKKCLKMYLKGVHNGPKIQFWRYLCETWRKAIFGRPYSVFSIICNFRAHWKMEQMLKICIKQKLQKHIQQPTKIHQKTVPVATKMESRKQSANMYQKIRGNCWKWTPKWEPILGHILAIWPFFAVPGKPWEPNWLPRPSQESPGPVQASICIDFRWIWVDFVMICRVMWATFCLVCLVSFVGLLNHFWWFIASPTF